MDRTTDYIGLAQKQKPKQHSQKLGQLLRKQVSRYKLTRKKKALFLEKKIPILSNLWSCYCQRDTNSPLKGRRNCKQDT